MDGSAFRNFDLGGLFWWALFGMAVAAIGALVGAIALIWFVINHVEIV